MESRAVKDCVLLFVINDIDFFLSHRLPIALTAKSKGYKVHVAARGCLPEKVARYGFVAHDVWISRSGVNPFWELWSLLRIFWTMLSVRPDVVHLVTIKPVLYGGIAARMAGVKCVVSAISGLGHSYDRFRSSNSFYQTLFKLGYRFALKQRNFAVIFQNSDDMRALSAIAELRPEDCVLIKGSGVDLAEYYTRPEPSGRLTAGFASRLLQNKGVIEFVEAATILKQRGVKAKFVVAGEPDPANPRSVTEAQLAAWKRAGVATFVGRCTNIPAFFEACHIVVLPSYYGEGLPRVLVEAAACGRAVITTDHPGCRDAIEPGQTGILVPVRDPMALADAMERLLLNNNLRQSMGRAGRLLAERWFSIESIVAQHLQVYERLLSKASIQKTGA